MKASDKPSLPREANPVRVRSQYLRSRDLARAAVRADRAGSNPGTRDRKVDRVLAALSLRCKVALVEAIASPSLRGRARFATLRKLSRRYYRALAQWKGDYRRNRAL